jgi:hypothetical protein
MKDILKSHKWRESKKQGAGWVRPSTIKAAFTVLRLIDMTIRIVSKLL